MNFKINVKRNLQFNQNFAFLEKNYIINLELKFNYLALLFSSNKYKIAL